VPRQQPGGSRWWEVLKVPLIAGDNVVAVEAAPGIGLPGILFRAEILREDLPGTSICSDDDWKARQLPSTEGNEADKVPEWALPGYDYSGWSNSRVLGRYGDAPWGRSEHS
jgi:hypothetical protein